MLTVMRNATEEERYTIARNMRKHNRPIDEIVEDTGLTSKEVRSLRNAD